MMGEEVFQGLKVLDFSWAIAGPWTVKYLADHGAMVIHVETARHPDIIRAGPPFKDDKPGVDSSVYWANYHCNKYGLSLNMSKNTRLLGRCDRGKLFTGCHAKVGIVV